MCVLGKALGWEWEWGRMKSSGVWPYRTASSKLSSHFVHHPPAPQLVLDLPNQLPNSREAQKCHALHP